MYVYLCILMYECMDGKARDKGVHRSLYLCIHMYLHEWNAYTHMDVSRHICLYVYEFISTVITANELWGNSYH